MSGPSESPGVGIHWPERFRPDRAPVHVRNEIEIEAPPERVWSWLVRAPSWPAWYPNASEVRVEGGAAVLVMGTRFRWRTFGVTIESTVREFTPPQRLGWDGRRPGLEIYHAWWIRPTPTGSHVLTEESQYGVLARVDHALRPQRMHAGHELWLERLRSRVLAGTDAPTP